MRKVVLMVAVFVLLVFSAAWAEEGSKFAVLDVQRIVDKSKHGQKITSDVKVFTEKKREIVKSKLAEREKKASDLEKQLKSGIISEEAAKKKVAEFQKYAEDVENFAREAEEEARQFANEQKLLIIRDLEGLVDKVAVEKGYDLIFRYESVVYNSPNVVDITDDVILKYDSLNAGN